MESEIIKTIFTEKSFNISHHSLKKMSRLKDKSLQLPDLSLYNLFKISIDSE